MSVEREFRCRRVERLAIVKFDARSQLYDDGLAVGGGLVGEGELRYDLEVFIDVEQLVAKTGEDDAADVGSGCRGIKVVGIFGESDPERGLSQCRGGHHDTQDDADKNPREPHRTHFLLATSSPRTVSYHRTLEQWGEGYHAEVSCVTELTWLLLLGSVG